MEIVNVLTKINRIIWFDFSIIKRASEYTYPITGVDYIHIATMEINLAWEVISVDNV